jgi:hypothetical protein
MDKGKPSWKTVLRSACHQAGVHRTRHLDAVEVVGATYSKAKWFWDDVHTVLEAIEVEDANYSQAKESIRGGWKCNACAEPCNTWGKTVRDRRYENHIRVYAQECGDVFWNEVQPSRVHIPNYFTKTCSCGCGQVAELWDYDSVQAFFSRILNAKREAFAKCISRDIAKNVIKCKNWEHCRFASETYDEAWSEEQIAEKGLTGHLAECPRLKVSRKKKRIGFAAKPKTKLIHDDETLDDLIQRLVEAKNRKEGTDNVQEEAQG